MFRKWGYSYPKVIWRTKGIDQAEAMGRLRITKRRCEEAKGLYSIHNQWIESDFGVTRRTEGEEEEEGEERSVPN